MVLVYLMERKTEETGFSFHYLRAVAVVRFDVNESMDNTGSGRKKKWSMIDDYDDDDIDEKLNWCLVSSTPWEERAFTLETLSERRESTGRCSRSENMRERWRGELNYFDFFHDVSGLIQWQTKIMQMMVKIDRSRSFSWFRPNICWLLGVWRIISTKIPNISFKEIKIYVPISLRVSAGDLWFVRVALRLKFTAIHRIDQLSDHPNGLHALGSSPIDREYVFMTWTEAKYARWY